MTPPNTNKNRDTVKKMPKKHSKSVETNDNVYHPGELVLYQFPPNHIRSEEWVKALIIKVFKDSVELEIENKLQITHWKNRIKKHGSR